MKTMLYEAVFWRDVPKRPAYDEAMAMPSVSKVLADWGEREGDLGVVVLRDSEPVGAAWFRCWTDEDHVLGYLQADIPVLVIAVQEDMRGQGIGLQLLERLFEQAAEAGVKSISLNVTRGNDAEHLYRKVGFQEHLDNGEAFLMIYEI